MGRREGLLPLRRVLPRLKATVLLAALSLTGCGLGKGDYRWIGEDAAVVRCTVSGANYTLPQLVMELPAPASPTGLYARVLDPTALDDLGFTRDRPVCASLEAPTDVELSAAEAALPALMQVRKEVAKQVRELGPCACEVARETGQRELLPKCVGRAWQPECEVKEFQRRDLAAALEPLEAALGKAEVPLMHWRLAGKTDRPGRFVARQSMLLPRHTGGSEVFRPGEPVAERLNHGLISALLQEEGVAAVVRQDGGKALLVVRVVSGDTLVFDHFAYPQVSPATIPLLPHLDNAQVDRYKAMLAAPSAERRLGLDPQDGTLIELDRAALERIDTGLALAAVLGSGYSAEGEEIVAPPAVFDRVTLLVPFGHEGNTVRGRMRLSDVGKAWVSGLGEAPLSPRLEELETPPVVANAKLGGPDPGFLVRGQPLDLIWFSGAQAWVEIMRAIELEAPGSVGGEGRQWTMKIPSGPLPGEFGTLPGLKRLRERLSKDRHTLSGTLKADELELGLAPR